MRSIKRLGLGLALAGLWAASAGPILAADNGTVDATVTVATPCITIVTPTIDFGTLPFSSQGFDAIGQHAITFENCGDAAERIWGAATDAQGPSATWDLITAFNGNICGHALNAYALELPSLDITLHQTAQELETLAAGTGNWRGVALSMPCVGSDGAGETMSFQVLLTATF